MAGDSWPPISNIKTGGSGYGKTNALLNLANNKSDTDEIYLLLIIHSNQNINYIN